MRVAAALVVWAFAGSVQAQEASLRQFLRLNAVGRLRSPEGRSILGEEASTWPARFGPIETEFDRLIKVGPDFAAARVETLGATGLPSVDFYFYLRRTKGSWKVVAFRTLALSGIVYAVRDGLRKRKDLSLEERQTLLNTELTLSSDRELRSYFAAHRSLLAGFASRTLGFSPKPDLKRDLEAEGFSTASKEKNVVRLTIGGVLDNSVGFLKVLNGVPPTISTHDVIWLEPLGSGWFLFKTT